jgi:hypothetical protein
VKVVISKKDSRENRLISSNAPVKDYKRDANGNLYLTFKGYVPLKIDFFLKDNCILKEIPKADDKMVEKNLVKLRYEKKREATIRTQCR